MNAVNLLGGTSRSDLHVEILVFMFLTFTTMVAANNTLFSGDSVIRYRGWVGND
jgi:hypothetical protein